MNCPKCNSLMEKVDYETIEVDRCIGCHGIWFDMLEAERLKTFKGSEKIDIGDPKQGKRYNAVEAINGSREQSALNRSLTEQAGDALNGISGLVATINDTNRAIVAGTEDEQAHLQALAAAVERVNELAGRTDASSSATAGSAREFMIMANQLQGLVSQFLLSADGAEAVQQPSVAGRDGDETAAPGSDIDLF